MEKAKILIVEDEAIIAMEIENQLQGLGYEVTSIVDTGEKAIKKAEEDKPDLILMDIRIKGEMDGIIAAEEIRNRYGIPVIFSTAYLDQERIDRAKITMPFGYVLKPIQERDLKVTIEMALYVSKADRERKKIEENLKENAFFLNKAQEIGQLGHFSLDPVTSIVEGSTELFRIFDVDPSKSLFEAFSSAIHPDDGHLIFPFIDRAVKEGISFDVEHRVLHQNGDVFHVNAKGEILSTSKGERMVGIVQDITERKQTEEKLQQVMAAVESTSDAIGISDAQGRHFYQNRALSELFGYKNAEELQAAGGGSAVVKDPEVAKEMFENIQSGKPRVGELEMTTKDRRVFPAFERANAIKDDSGNIIGLIGIISDITERKMAEEALRESEEWLSTTLRSIGDAVITTDTNGNITFLNPIAESLTGWNQNDSSGKPLNEVFNIINEKTRESVENPVEKVLISGNIVGLANHTVLISKDGKEIPIDDSGSPIKNKNGEIIGVVLVFRDIIERKQAEDALRESEEKYRTLIENIPGVSYRCECDENWTMRIISDEVEVLTGYPVSDFIDNNVRSWASTIHPDDKEGAEALAMEKISNQEPYNLEFRIIGKNGNIRWVHEKGQCIFNKEGKPLFLDGVIVDITDHKQVEEALIESEKRFKNMFRNSPEPLALSEIETGNFVEANLAFQETLQLKESEIEGKTSKELGLYLNPAVRDEMIVKMKQQGFAHDYEMTAVRKDGTQIIGLLSFSIMPVSGRMQMLSSFKDITTLKQAEEKIKASLKEKETLLHEIHHRVKNNMAVISSLLSLQGQ